MKDAASRPERIAVLCLALARTIYCGYRATTQSITVDEATTYLNYVRDHWANVWSTYDPNNHVLYSILAQLSVRALHISEISLRLPSVLAGFFLIVGVHRVLSATVSSAVIRWIAIVGVSLAPLLLDFSVAARGYGLGLALLVWAVNFSIRGNDVLAGILAGFSLATTINLAYAVAGVAAAPLVLDTDALRDRIGRSISFAVPATVIFLVIWNPILPQLSLGHFYVGLPTLKEALFDFIGLTIRVIPAHDGWFGGGDGIRAIQYFFLPAAMIFIVAVSTRWFRREPYFRRSLLPALTLFVDLAGIAAAHLVLGMNYPVDRLALHLFLLLALAWAIAVSQAPNPAIRAVNAVLAIILIAQFSTQFETRFFTLWQFDSGSRQIARIIRDDSRGRPRASVAISATWYMWPALEYYRVVYRMAAVRPLERHDPTPLEGFDYYVLSGDDRAAKAALTPSVMPLLRDDLSGTVLTK